MQKVVNKRHVIYKITNLINGRYYIGRHSTTNLNDGYMGSGKAIANAIKKYGENNFVKEIIAETSTSSELWELEKEIVNESVVYDPLSYNMAFGGKSYLDGLKKYNADKFIRHQSNAGKIGGSSCYSKKTDEDRKKWHSAGGKAAAKVHKQNSHPFYTGVAASLGGKAIKGMVELWNPTAKATNKNQTEYKPGDSKRAKIDSQKYNDLISQGWLLIEEHKNRSKAW